MTSLNLYCNACFSAGINFAASLVSLFYGKGDFLESIKIGPSVVGMLIILQQHGVDLKNNQWYVPEIVERLNR